MKSKFITLGLIALAIAACDQESQKPVASVYQNSSGDQMFAYMVGTQMGENTFGPLARQMGEYVNKEALVQGVRDMMKSNKDTSFHLQLTQDTIATLNARYATIGRERYESTKPDSATGANLGSNVGAYMDSVQRSLPIKPALEGVALPVKLEDNSPQNLKFSYLVGLQLGNNFRNLNAQFDTEFEQEYFEMGILDGAAHSLDSSFAYKVPKDTLDSIGVRYRAKYDSIREAYNQKVREEEERLKAEVKALRGDTLVNGMPAKMNASVKVSGVSYSGETLADFIGKPLFVFYFSTTCPHCRKASSSILEVADEFAKSGLTTLAVASGGNAKRMVRSFIDDHGWNENIKVGWDEHRQFGELYSDGYVPKIYLVNPDGSYRLYTSIEKDKNELKADISALLGGKNVEWKIAAPAADSAAASN